MKITRGLAEAERQAAAALYWQAFAPKLGPVLGPRDKALIYLAQAFDPDQAICARDGNGVLLGIVGLHTPRGRLWRVGLGPLMRVFGPIGALWRLAAFYLLPRDEVSGAAVIDGIAVAAAARGRGIGSRLIEAAAHEARAEGLAGLRLEVAAGNDRARALYERRGFAKVGERRLHGLAARLWGHSGTAVMERRIRP